MRALLTTALLAVSGVAWGAEVRETEITSYRDMHKNTEYGTWFLNFGAVRSATNKDTRRFREIVGMDEIEGLPDQRGYCFVMNNFGSDRPQGSRGELNVTVVKRGQLAIAGGKFVDKAEQEMDPIRYVDTMDAQARNPPAFCVSQLVGVTELELNIAGSVDGIGRRYVLKLKSD